LQPERSRAISTKTVADRTPAVLIARAEAEFRRGRELEAARLLEQALAVDPASVQARFWLAEIRANRPRSAEDLETALGLTRGLPNHHDVHLIAGKACFYLDRVDECRQHYATAIDMMSPQAPSYGQARFNMATMRLCEGDLTVWPEYDDLLNRQPERRARFDLGTPRWDGSPLVGRKIFLHTILDGFGDAMQFARFIPRVVAMGGHVTLVCQPDLGPLFFNSHQHLGFHCVIRLGSSVPAEIARHDLHAELKSLPAIFGTTLESIPATIPYLTADAKSIEGWRPAIEAIPGLRVGIAWRGDPGHFLDKLRSFDLDKLAPLAEVPGVTLVSLQKGHGAGDLAGLRGRFKVVELGPAYAAGDWADTAAVVRQLDLVITPDTAIAHLAGGLGKPTWVALPRPSEWRWMRDREDSPWYPTMRLFRQDRLSEWGPVFARMADRLAQRSSGLPT
jgi:hypothetical protein